MELFKRHLPWVVAFVLALFLVGGYRFLFSPPANFPSGSIIIISQGTSAPLVAQELADAHIIAHPMLLQLIMRLSGKDDRIQAGAYRFQTPQNLFNIAYRIITGAYGVPPSRITFPEGTTVRDMATQITETFP
ncbi:MAG: endolytic transglycosylase MltG, partial [bacterium]|nr:endolytic transglycosylase MltG [bacterium]